MEFYDDHKPINNRSKAYPSLKVAQEKAAQYIGEGRAEQYYVMECKKLVRKKPVDIEVIDIKK